MNKIKKIVSENLCTGCSACADSCPKDAVSIVTDQNGFKIPQIESNKCTACGICEKVCPVISYKNDHFAEPDVYAARAADTIRMHASSGGVFPVIAEAVLEEHGVCIGAGWDTATTVKHMAVFRMEGLKKIQGSKYMQSDLSGCMRMAKKYLETGRKVLFTGTPCQVAGLDKFLGKKYPNLLTIDLICHGVPSDLMVEKYFGEITGGGVQGKSKKLISVKKNWVGVQETLR